ncbi:glycosyltransferase [candidate division KSB1 bacterium]
MVDYITLSVIILGCLYILLDAALIIGLLRLPEKNVTHEPLVSVLVPARNEEDSIGRCLESLAQIEYPRDKLQVIIVDDHSVDGTYTAAKAFADRFHSFHIIRMSEIPGDSEGKIAALAEGYRKAEGVIVLQTDADCSVPRTWVRTYVRYFDDKTGIVGGITLLEKNSSRKTCFTAIQSLDWLYLLNVGAAAIGIGFPLSCIGNNLAIRKTAYLDAGGYEAIPFTFTEDFAIFRAVVKAGWKSSFIPGGDGLVLSRPPATFMEFLRQRMRWASGGIKLAGWGTLLLVTAFLYHLAIIISLPLGIPVYVWITAVLATAAGDFVFLYISAAKVNRKQLLRYYPVFIVYYYIYTTVFGLILPFQTAVTWKGRKLNASILSQ